MTANAIVFRQVMKRFGIVRAVDEVSSAFLRGALVMLLGLSARGKAHHKPDRPALLRPSRARQPGKA